MTSYWDSYEKGEFAAASMGQISMQTKAGQEIFRVLQEESGKDIQTIVEIGTWNGRGSTMCILFGINGSSFKSFHSIECNRDKYLSAVDVLEGHIDNNTYLMWGSIVNTEYIRSEEYRNNFPSLKHSEQLLGWFNIDLQNCEAAPNILGALPDKIDFLLLDGGEYTTLNEFEVLLPRCTRYIAMDDTNQDKCRECRRRLQADPRWTEISCIDERNGFSIFKITA
jgi:hypothetical protein